MSLTSYSTHHDYHDVTIMSDYVTVSLISGSFFLTIMSLHYLTMNNYFNDVISIISSLTMSFGIYDVYYCYYVTIISIISIEK